MPKNASEQCKISKLASNSHWAEQMMFKCKITDSEVKFLKSLCKYHDVKTAIDDAAPYTLC